MDTAETGGLSPERVITESEFPAQIAAGESFRFTFEGATYRAKANCLHVFHEAKALAEHLSQAGRGVYDGLTILP